MTPTATTCQPALGPVLPSWRRLRAALALALPVALAGWMAPAQAAVMISQVYGGGGNSGAPLFNDFVELHNNGATPVNLSGWSLQYSSATGTSWAGQNIPLSGSIPAGGYFLIQLGTGGASGAALPTPNVSSIINVSAMAGKFALVNSTTALAAVTCPLPGATVVDFVGYGATANCSETAAAPAPSATTAIVRADVSPNSCLDSGNNSTDFATQAPLPRNAASPAQLCRSGGGGGGGGTPVAATIPTIQGSGASSSLAGQLVITSGVVTKINSNGFFIQDLAGDGNPATSDGIFVFAAPNSFTAVQVGNLIQVTGRVTEFSAGAGTAASPLTQLTSVSAVTLQGTSQIITSVSVTLPLAPGDSLERFEGMLVRIEGSLTAQQNFFQARFGQVTLGAGGRHETPTNRFRPGTQAIALADQQARGRVLLDDGSSAQNPNPTPYFLANGVPRAGDTVSNLIGVIDFGLATSSSAGAGLYRLHPTSAPDFSASNPRPAAPAAVGGNLRVGSMNVLNFFTTFTDGTTASGLTGQGCTLGSITSAGNCRGANNLAEFNRQRSKIVKALAGLNADAVGLMEIQNNGNTAAQNLVDAVNAQVGADTYAVVPLPLPAASTGTDAIRVAMIYKPSRLALSGGALSDTAAVNNRPTLAQTFVAANGEKFSLLVNHLKSKGSCPATGDADAPGNLDSGDGQGCWNLLRLQQAQQLRVFVAQVQTGSGSNDALLVGDLNAYAQEDPIFELTSNGYIDQVGRFNALGYTYVFDGAAGRLDHAISTASLSSKVSGTAQWHINADEQLSYDYNQEFKAPAVSCGGLCPPDPANVDDPYRSSDHDPVLVGLNIYRQVPVTAPRQTLTGGVGADRFVYTSVLQGGGTLIGFEPGVDIISVGAILASIGRSALANPIGSGHITCTSSRGSALLGIDTDGSAGPLPNRPLVLVSGQGCAAVLVVRNFQF